MQFAVVMATETAAKVQSENAVNGPTADRQRRRRKHLVTKVCFFEKGI